MIVKFDQGRDLCNGSENHRLDKEGLFRCFWKCRCRVPFEYLIAGKAERESEWLCGEEDKQRPYIDENMFATSFFFFCMGKFVRVYMKSNNVTVILVSSP